MHDSIELSPGEVSYQLAGPPDGEPAVLVHGFSSPCFVWDPIFEALIDAGYRVLRYDLYGRGRSAKPRIAYGADLYFEQLDGLVEALSLPRPFHLFGLSMGGAIAVDFAHRRPDDVDSLVLIAPAGMPMPVPLSVRLLEVPIIGEILMHLVGRRAILKGAGRGLNDPDERSAFLEHYRHQLSDPGYLPALLSTLREMPLQELEPTYRKVGRIRRDKRQMLVWGTDDAILPFHLHQRVLGALDPCEMLTVEGGGHVPHWEHPDEVIPGLLEFLRG